VGKKVIKKAFKATLFPPLAATGLAKDVGGAIADDALEQIAPGTPPIEVPEVSSGLPEENEEAVAATEVRRRQQPRARSRTLLGSALGGSQATVGKPTLLGGG